MADIFVAVPGRAVIAARNQGPKGLLFSLPSQDTLSGIVTRLSLSQQVAAQIQPSLNKTFYITSFGDQPGALEIGVLLNTSCDSGTNLVDQFISYYRDQRLTPDTASPSSMAIGSSTFLGYVTGFSVDGQSSSGHVINGTIRYVVWMAL
jgi:hypothetical protein